MTEKQIKVYAIKQFPYDEFKQQIIIDSINWATKELEQENNKLLDVINNQDVKIADLEKQIEKMQNCRNCKNYMIEGACGHFTQVGWCKNWELKEIEK